MEALFWIPRGLKFLGGSEFRLRQGFAKAKRLNAGLPARHGTKKCVKFIRPYFIAAQTSEAFVMRRGKATK